MWYQVRKKIDDMRPTLPSDLQGPFFNDEFGDTFGNIYALTCDGFSYAEAKDFAEAARYEFLQLRRRHEGRASSASRTRRSTSRRRAPSSPRSASIRRPIVVDAELDQQRRSRRHGREHRRARQRAHLRRVHVARLASASIGIRAGDRMFRLGDIADVRRGYQDPPTMKMRFQGKEAIGIAVSMRKGGDVIRLGRADDRDRRAPAARTSRSASRSTRCPTSRKWCRTRSASS